MDLSCRKMVQISILLLSFYSCANLPMAGGSTTDMESNPSSSSMLQHPYAEFIWNWNHRNSYDNYCFFSPMNCPFHKTSPYGVMVKDDEWAVFLRTLNAFRRKMEQEKLEKRKTVNQRRRKGTRRKAAVQHQKQLNLQNDI